MFFWASVLLGKCTVEKCAGKCIGGQVCWESSVLVGKCASEQMCCQSRVLVGSVLSVKYFGRQVCWLASVLADKCAVSVQICCWERLPAHWTTAVSDASFMPPLIASIYFFIFFFKIVYKIIHTV